MVVGLEDDVCEISGRRLDADWGDAREGGGRVSPRMLHYRCHWIGTKIGATWVGFDYHLQVVTAGGD